MGDDGCGHRRIRGALVALKESRLIKNAVNWASWTIALIAVALVGCGIGRVVTEPVRYVFSGPEPTPSANTSDVTHPGRPVAVPSPTPRTASRKSSQSPTQAPPRVATSKSAPSSSSPQKSPSAPQFPVAKPVPGKPGLVLNPFNPKGAYIDVSGYAPGSKVKDPDSQQIFVVP